uniref:Uncharacterized protein n=1 Tax=Sipha flava TaxID=143950 RepID=A0A2S2QKW7_9HEMI
MHDSTTGPEHWVYLGESSYTYDSTWCEHFTDRNFADPILSGGWTTQMSLCGSSVNFSNGRIWPPQWPVSTRPNDDEQEETRPDREVINGWRGTVYAVGIKQKTTARIWRDLIARAQKRHF